MSVYAFADDAVDLGVFFRGVLGQEGVEIGHFALLGLKRERVGLVVSRVYMVEGLDTKAGHQGNRSID